MLYRHFGKRLLDILVSSIALILLSPLLLLVAVTVWFRLGSPILFRQQRPGMHAQPFEMVKFRSMKETVDANGIPLSDAQRLTRFGQLLRATSMDELPELWNVLKGQMSLVGPRPLLMEYLPMYSPTQARRHEVRPGITGWAQVNGRNALDWESRFELDIWYIDNLSFWLDVKILYMTVKSVFKRDGISAQGHATVEKFRGSDHR